MSTTFELIRRHSTAAEFHALDLPDPVTPQIWWHELTAPALVLGSTQANDVVDMEVCRARGIDVVRRRSGGGAVLLIPGEVTWIDVIIPTNTPGWSVDVHGPMVWIGTHLADVLRPLLSGSSPDEHHDLQAHAGKLRSTRWSSAVCFDGIGAGEVLLDGHKLVGISQRRTRAAARLQCCWYSAYDPEGLVSLLAPTTRPPDGDLRPVATIARTVATSLPPALVTHLNT